MSMSFARALLSSTDFILSTSFILTILLSLRMYPVIIYVNRIKNLIDLPDDRKIHEQGVPTHGGVGIFIAFSLAVMMTALIKGLIQDDLIKVISLFLCALILFFFGLKDDLVGLEPKKKFVGQIIAAAIVIYFADVRILSLEGIFGVENLPYAISVAFTVFVFLLVINAYNLIDGIDGLAGSVAVVSGFFFGIFFMFNDYFLQGLVSLSLAAAVLGFLRFNLSNRKRLFMGDSGSLFVGFVLAWLGIEFLGANQALAAGIRVPNASMMLLAILCYPLLDTLRVFIIRIRHGRSPFSADRNHIHHRLLDIGLSHKQATLYIVLTNIVTVWIVFSINDLNINLQLLIMLSLIPVLFTGPFLRIGRKSRDWQRPVEVLIKNDEDSAMKTANQVGKSDNQRFYVVNVIRPRPVFVQDKQTETDHDNAEKKINQAQLIVDKRVEVYNKSKLNQEEIERGDSELKSE